MMAKGKQRPKHFHSSVWTAKTDLQIPKEQFWGTASFYSTEISQYDLKLSGKLYDLKVK